MLTDAEKAKIRACMLALQAGVEGHGVDRRTGGLRQDPIGGRSDRPQAREIGSDDGEAAAGAWGLHEGFGALGRPGKKEDVPFRLLGQET